MSDVQQQPSELQIRRAKERGQFARSRELVSASVWIAGLGVLGTTGVAIWNYCVLLAQQSWGTIDMESASEGIVWPTIAKCSLLLGQVLLPFLIVVGVLAVITAAVQSEFRLSPQRAMPDPERLSPARYFQKLFSLETFAATALGFCKFAFLACIAVWVLWHDLPELMVVVENQSLQKSFEGLMHSLFNMSLKLGLAAGGVALLDYGIQWWIHRRRLSMSDEEIREEQRQTEPAPEITARRRLISEGMRQRRPPVEHRSP